MHEAVPTAPTADRLITAAEQLFALHGIDGISLREINRAAGARNGSALQYHFRDREGLLRAVMAKHHREVEARRHAMLDAYEAEGRDDVRALAGALVRPLASKLADEDGGPHYLQILADLINRPRPVINPADLDDPTSSIFRWRNLVGRLLEDDATRLHRRFVAIRFAAVELGRRARSAPHSDDRLFTSHLVDLVAGVLSTPLSDETRRLAAERPQ
ncbi:MAG TPA: helix-turn-helix domain-containing protein [Acidimicrobiales bacterium]|jgi:AcrR family transcriptional regulator|nr:helix-turn-helix domain-containing protein [Acidimicrobiales bacterium]